MKQSNLVKIHFILEQIDRIDRIIRRHRGVVAAMEDFEGEMALLMGIAQIGETLNKIDDSLIRVLDLQKDRDGAYYTRNYIVHDYENVDRMLIEDILRHHLPKMRQKLIRFIEKTDS